MRTVKIESFVRENGTLRVRSVFEGAGKTQQHFKDECDINNIVKRYESTGEFPRLTQKQGVYGDFSEIQDYQGMMNTVLRAQEAFMTLPAKTRAKFQNDPGALIEFLKDPKNREEAIELGLIEKKEPRPGDMTLRGKLVKPGGEVVEPEAEEPPPKPPTKKGSGKPGVSLKDEE